MSAPRLEDTPWTPAALKDFRRRFPNSRAPAAEHMGHDQRSRRFAALKARESEIAKRLAEAEERELELRVLELEEALAAKHKYLEDRKKARMMRVPRAVLLKLVSQHSKIDAALIKGRKRDKPIVQARQALMWLALKWGVNASTTSVGDWFDRDHSTVCHSVRKVNENWPVFSELIVAVELAIRKSYPQTPTNSVNSANKGMLPLPGAISTCHQQRANETETHA